jgi:hypothetical protein
MYAQTGMPLHWPQALGGWGLPGLPQAPNIYKKAAAVALAGDWPFVKQMRQVFILQGAPESSRNKLQLALERLDSEDEFDMENPPTQKQAEAELTQRVTTFLHLLQDKSAVNHRPSIGAIASRVRRLVLSEAKKWQSVKPVGETRALQILKERIAEWEDAPRAVNLDTIMEDINLPDAFSRQATAGLPPNKRLQLYVPSKVRKLELRVEQQPAVADQAIRARNALLETQEPPRPDPPTTDGKIPVWLGRDPKNEWPAANKLRELFRVRGQERAPQPLSAHSKPS